MHESNENIIIFSSLLYEWCHLSARRARDVRESRERNLRSMPSSYFYEHLIKSHQLSSPSIQNTHKTLVVEKIPLSEGMYIILLKKLCNLYLHSERWISGWNEVEKC